MAKNRYNKEINLNRQFGLGTFGFFPLHQNSGKAESTKPEFKCRGKKPNVPNPNFDVGG